MKRVIHSGLFQTETPKVSSFTLIYLNQSPRNDTYSTSQITNIMPISTILRIQSDHLFWRTRVYNFWFEWGFTSSGYLVPYFGPFVAKSMNNWNYIQERNPHFSSLVILVWAICRLRTFCLCSDFDVFIFFFFSFSILNRRQWMMKT